MDYTTPIKTLLKINMEHYKHIAQHQGAITLADKFLPRILQILEDWGIPVKTVDWGIFWRTIILQDETKISKPCFANLCGLLKCESKDVERSVNDGSISFSFPLVLDSGAEYKLLLRNGSGTCKVRETRYETYIPGYYNVYSTYEAEGDCGEFM